MANIAKILKQKRDAEERLRQNDTVPKIQENASGQTYYRTPANAQAEIVEGKNINITANLNKWTIDAVMNLLEGNNINITGPDENGALTIDMVDVPDDGLPYIREDGEWIKALIPRDSYMYAPGVHRYWRIYIIDGNSGSALSLGEVQFRSVEGVAEQATGGTAISGGDQAGYAKERAFDNNTGNQWAASPVTNNYIGYIFAATKEVVEVALWPGFSGESPKNFYVQYSDNGTTWTTITSTQTTDKTSWPSEYFIIPIEHDSRTDFIRTNTATSDTLTLYDIGFTVVENNASDITLTIPTNATVAFPVGTVIKFVQAGAGAVIFTPDTGVTLNAISGVDKKTTAQWDKKELIKIGEDEWLFTT